MGTVEMSEQMSRAKQVDRNLATDGEIMLLITRAATIQAKQLLAHRAEALDYCVEEQMRLLSTCADFSEKKVMIEHCALMRMLLDNIVADSKNENSRSPPDYGQTARSVQVPKP